MAKQDKLERVPPIFPIIWQDWESDPDMQQMSVAEEGFFFRFLRKQWVLGELPADPWRLSRLLNTKYETTKKWLQKWSHLVVRVESPCSQHGVTLDSTCTRCGVTLYNKKLKFLRIDVISDVALGTTEPQQEPKPKPIEPQPPAPQGNGGDGEPEVPLPEQRRAPESDTSDPKVRKATAHFWKLLGSPKKYSTEPAAQRWDALIEPKLRNSALEYVTGIMDYALTVNSVWMRAISTVKKQDPMEYFVEKYETIEGNREGDEKFAKLNKKSGAAAPQRGTWDIGTTEI